MGRLSAAAVAVLIGLILLLAFLPDSPDVTIKPDQSAQSEERVWNLRFGHNMPQDSAMHEAAALYAKTVEEKSKGRVRITVFPNQKLGNDHQMLEMARRGDLDIVLTPTAKISAAMPSMQYVDLPFFFPQREDLYAMLDGEPGQLLLNGLKQIDLIGVTFWENGFKHFTANTPLLRADDFKGKKFRIMKSRLIQAQFDALGAKTYLIDFHETRKALSDGVVEGQENPLIAIKSMGIHEVQKHLTLSSHGYMGYVFSISAHTFKSLPPDLQDLLYRSARDLTAFEREQTRKREAKLLDRMRQSGMQIHTLSEKAHAELRDKTAHIIPRFEEVIGSHVLSTTQELLLNKYGPSPESKQQIVIGLNADLSMDTKIGGLAIKRGAELAIEEINANGGVLGKPLVLIAKDDRGIASKGAANVKLFAERSDVVAIIGGVRSGVSATAIAQVQSSGIPYLIPWAAAAELTNPANDFVFRVSANDRDAVAFMGNYLLQHYRSPAIIYENTIWGRGAMSRMKQVSASKGRSLSDAVAFNIGQQNFKPEIDRIVRSGADSILMIAASDEAAKIINTLSESKSPLPVVAHWGITANRFFYATEESRKRVDLQFFQTFSFLTSPTPKKDALGRRYLHRYGVSSLNTIKAPSGVAQSYDTVHLLARAVQKAGTTDRYAVRNALERLEPYEGVIRRYAPPFTPERHDGLSPENYQIARYHPDGFIVSNPKPR